MKETFFSPRKLRIKENILKSCLYKVYIVMKGQQLKRHMKEMWGFYVVISKISKPWTKGKECRLEMKIVVSVASPEGWCCSPDSQGDTGTNCVLVCMGNDPSQSNVQWSSTETRVTIPQKLAIPQKKRKKKRKVKQSERSERDIKHGKNGTHHLCLGWYNKAQSLNSEYTRKPVEVQSRVSAW